MSSNITHGRLRVAFLTPSLHIGGAERWILSLARNFQSVQPTGVVVCAPHAHPAMLEQAARLMPVYLARKLGDAGETRRLLERACITADLLVTWGVPRLSMVTRELVGRIANPSVKSGRIGNPPYIPVVDVSHSDGRWAQQTKMVRRAASGADFHVAVSRCALAAFPVDIRRRATVIYNGVEVDRIAPRRPAALQRRAWRVGENDKVVLFLGRYDDVKQPLRLLDAIAHLPPDWKIVFHGHGPLECRLRSAECGVNAAAAPRGDDFRASLLRTPHSALHTRVFGPLSHVGDALAAADVLAMPSKFEGMPLALVEAWLAGTPTVATPIGFVDESTAMHGPLCEVVPNEPTGRQLADGIVRASRAKFVDAARRVAWNHYTAAAMAQRWEEYLHEVYSVFGFQCSETDARNGN